MLAPSQIRCLIRVGSRIAPIKSTKTLPHFTPRRLHTPAPSARPNVQSTTNTRSSKIQCSTQVQNQISSTRFISQDSQPRLPTGEVSSTSTTRSVTLEVGQQGQGSVLPPAKDDVDMGKAIKGDIKAIRETFALDTVPREAYVLGLAGTIPYFATSLTTLFCAWDLNYAATHGAGYLITEDTAYQLLTFLEPIQVGYGAVILSSLGAVHWGLEWAGYGGYHSYRRYAIGVIAPVVAWPTLLFTYEWALATQFLAFTMLYFVDSTLTTRAWTPPWYSAYRFVLTFIVGASIVVSLIGRGEIADRDSKRALPQAVDRIKGQDHIIDKRAKYEGDRAKVMEAKAKEEAKQKEKEEKIRKAQEEKEEREKREKKEKADEEENADSKGESED